MVVLSSIGHTGRAGVRPGEVDHLGQLEQCDVMLDWVRIHKGSVGDDLRDFDV